MKVQIEDMSSQYVSVGILSVDKYSSSVWNIVASALNLKLKLTNKMYCKIYFEINMNIIEEANATSGV